MHFSSFFIAFATFEKMCKNAVLLSPEDMEIKNMTSPYCVKWDFSFSRHFNQDLRNVITFEWYWLSYLACFKYTVLQIEIQTFFCPPVKFLKWRLSCFEFPCYKLRNLSFSIIKFITQMTIYCVIFITHAWSVLLFVHVERVVNDRMEVALKK